MTDTEALAVKLDRITFLLVVLLVLQAVHVFGDLFLGRNIVAWTAFGLLTVATLFFVGIELFVEE